MKDRITPPPPNKTASYIVKGSWEAFKGSNITWLHALSRIFPPSRLLSDSSPAPGKLWSCQYTDSREGWTRSLVPDNTNSFHLPVLLANNARHSTQEQPLGWLWAGMGIKALVKSTLATIKFVLNLFPNQVLPCIFINGPYCNKGPMPYIRYLV